MSGIPFFVHDLGQAELDAIAEVFGGRILTTGDTVADFEAKFGAHLGRRHALGLNSCTGALHLSLEALGIGPGDEVITTPLTFIATGTAIVSAGARPVFVDVEADTGNLDASLIAAAVTPRTKAILPVHLYGLMCDMRAIRTIADEHGLSVVEDAAHCIEGSRDGIRPGELGDTACFSFFATKNLTCGEGGAVVTDDAEVYERMRRLSLHGMTKTAADRLREGYRHWDMPEFGWKYNLSNIQAAILLPQLDRLAKKSQLRDELAARYEKQIAEIAGVETVASRSNAQHARHLFPVRVAPESRDRLVEALKADGIEVVVNYRAIHSLDYFRRTLGLARGAFPVAETFGDSVLSLPFYPAMPTSHVDTVCDALEKHVAHATV